MDNLDLITKSLVFYLCEADQRDATEKLYNDWSMQSGVEVSQHSTVVLIFRLIEEFRKTEDFKRLKFVVGGWKWQKKK